MKIVTLGHNAEEAALICQVLTAAGHTCHAFQNSAEVSVQLRRDNIDLLVVDWEADGEGLHLTLAELLSAVREKSPAQVPVLFMVHGSHTDDVIAGWAAGANDYLVKPIRRGELVLRVQALLRRAHPDHDPVEHIRFGDYVFESPTGRLSLNGDEIEVTQKEFKLALLLFRNLGRPLSRAYILESVWAQDAEIPSRTMDTHVSRVRSKLQLRPEHGFRLAPVYSYGYRLEQL